MTSGYNTGGDGGFINAYYSIDMPTTNAPIESWTYAATTIPSYQAYRTAPSINGEEWISFQIDENGIASPKAKEVPEWDD